MKLPDTTLDFNNLLLKSQTYEVDSSYGKIIYRKIGDICFAKNIPESWSRNEYHPAKFFTCYGAKLKKGDLYLTIEEQSKLSEEEFKDYHTCSYSVLLEEDNKGWFETNKEFLNNLHKDDDRRTYIRHKELPIGEVLDDFIGWHTVSLDCLDDKWIAKNPEYIQMWRDEIKHQENLFFEAVENEDMKGIRKASARLVNLKCDNEKALNVAIEKDNEQMVTYFIGKKFYVTREHLAAAKSEEVSKRLLKVVKANEKRQEKELARTNKMKLK